LPVELSRSNQGIEAVSHQQHTDPHPQPTRLRPLQHRNAERNAERAANEKRPQPARVERPPQLPNRDARHDEAEADDQSGGVAGREHMQPCRGRDKPERKAGEAGNERRRKGGRRKIESSKAGTPSMARPRSKRAALGWRAI